MQRRWLANSMVLLCFSALCAGEVLDRLIATVNGHAILQSDWNDELRFECLMSGRSFQDLSGEDRRAAFERLIDQELLREQMGLGDFTAATPEQISTQLENVKRQYQQQHAGETWSAALLRSGLTDKQVSDHVANEFNSLRFVNGHLRSSIQIDAAAIDDYYKNQFLTKLPSGRQMSLQDATPEIREILIQQKMNELLNSWLASLRSQAQIRIVEPQLAEPVNSQVRQ